MLLYPGPVLLLARMHESRWSLVMTVLAYIMVVKALPCCSARTSSESPLLSF